MKKVAFLCMVMVAMAMTLQAQKRESEAAVVTFKVADEDKLQVKGESTFLIEVTPKTGWHVYSALPSEEGAYQPAVLGWEVESRGFTSGDKLLEEGPLMSSFDDIMGGTVRYYKTKVVFSQPVTITEPEVIMVGYFDYMACNEEKCIPLTAEFKVEAKAKD